MQTLWNNVNIKYKGELLFFKDWKRAGIERVNDIIKEDHSRLLTLEEITRIVQTHPAIVLFQYNALINAVPEQWKRWVVQCGYLHTQQQHIFDISKYCQKPKLIRNMLCENDTNKDRIKTCAEGFWRRKVNIEIDKTIWLIPHISTKEIRLRELQWKIIHNLYPTNILLNKMKVTDDNKCPLCRDEVDYLEHFFFFCPPVRQFWTQIELYLKSLIGIQIDLQVSNVLFGIRDKMKIDQQRFHSINHIILIAKMTISIYKKTCARGNIFLLFEQQMQYRSP